MQGILVSTGQNDQSGIIYGVRPLLFKGVICREDRLGEEVFPVPSVDVDVRRVGVGSLIAFHTEEGNGQARIDEPLPVRGIGLERR